MNDSQEHSPLWFQLIGAAEASPEKLNHLSPGIRRKERRKKRGTEFVAAPAGPAAPVAAPAGDDKLAALYAALIAKGTDPKRARELARRALAREKANERRGGERRPKTDLVTKIGSFAEDGSFIQHA